MTVSDGGLSRAARPSESTNTSGNSTIVCPMAHRIPDNVPSLVARNVEAKSKGPGLRTPETLTTKTVNRNSS